MNSSSSESVYDSNVTLPEAIIEGIILSAICVVAVTANVLLWMVVLTSRDLRNESNVLILCLSLADLLVSVVSMPITVATIIAASWQFSSDTCTAIGFINMLTFTASVQSLGVISINRYVKICRPNLFVDIYTYRNVLLMFAGVWLVSGVLSLPPLLGWAVYSYLPYASLCFCDWSTSWSYAIFMIGVCFCVPCTVMTICYVSILKTYFQSRKTLRSFRDREIPRKDSNGDDMSNSGPSGGCCNGVRNIGRYLGIGNNCSSTDLPPDDFSDSTRVEFESDQGDSIWPQSNSISNGTSQNGTKQVSENSSSMSTGDGSEYEQPICSEPNPISTQTSQYDIEVIPGPSSTLFEHQIGEIENIELKKEDEEKRSVNGRSLRFVSSSNDTQDNSGSVHGLKYISTEAISLTQSDTPTTESVRHELTITGQVSTSDSNELNCSQNSKVSHGAKAFTVKIGAASSTYENLPFGENRNNIVAESECVSGEINSNQICNRDKNKGVNMLLDKSTSREYAGFSEKQSSFPSSHIQISFEGRTCGETYTDQSISDVSVDVCGHKDVTSLTNLRLTTTDITNYEAASENSRKDIVFLETPGQSSSVMDSKTDQTVRNKTFLPKREGNDEMDEKSGELSNVNCTEFPLEHTSELNVSSLSNLKQLVDSSQISGQFSSADSTGGNLTTDTGTNRSSQTSTKFTSSQQIDQLAVIGIPSGPAIDNCLQIPDNYLERTESDNVSLPVEAHSDLELVPSFDTSNVYESPGALFSMSGRSQVPGSINQGKNSTQYQLISVSPQSTLSSHNKQASQGHVFSIRPFSNPPMVSRSDTRGGGYFRTRYKKARKKRMFLHNYVNVASSSLTTIHEDRILELPVHNALHNKANGLSKGRADWSNYNRQKIFVAHRQPGLGQSAKGRLGQKRIMDFPVGKSVTVEQVSDSGHRLPLVSFPNESTHNRLSSVSLTEPTASATTENNQVPTELQTPSYFHTLPGFLQKLWSRNLKITSKVHPQSEVLNVRSNEINAICGVNHYCEDARNSVDDQTQGQLAESRLVDNAAALERTQYVNGWTDHKPGGTMTSNNGFSEPTSHSGNSESNTPAFYGRGTKPSGSTSHGHDSQTDKSELKTTVADTLRAIHLPFSSHGHLTNSEMTPQLLAVAYKLPLKSSVVQSSGSSLAGASTSYNTDYVAPHPTPSSSSSLGMSPNANFNVAVLPIHCSSTAESHSSTQPPRLGPLEIALSISPAVSMIIANPELYLRQGVAYDTHHQLLPYSQQEMPFASKLVPLPQPTNSAPPCSYSQKASTHVDVSSTSCQETSSHFQFSTPQQETTPTVNMQSSSASQTPFYPEHTTTHFVQLSQQSEKTMPYFKKIVPYPEQNLQCGDKKMPEICLHLERTSSVGEESSTHEEQISSSKEQTQTELEEHSTHQVQSLSSIHQTPPQLEKDSSSQPSDSLEQTPSHLEKCSTDQEQPWSSTEQKPEIKPTLHHVQPTLFPPQQISLDLCSTPDQENFQAGQITCQEVSLLESNGLQLESSPYQQNSPRNEPASTFRKVISEQKPKSNRSQPSDLKPSRKRNDNLLAPPRRRSRHCSLTSKSEKRKREEFQLSASLLVVILIFIICWFPYCISMLVSIFTPENSSRPLDMTSLLLGYLNSCVNPIVYGVMNKRFKAGYRNLFMTCLGFCRRRSKNFKVQKAFQHPRTKETIVVEISPVT